MYATNNIREEGECLLSNWDKSYNHIAQNNWERHKWETVHILIVQSSDALITELAEFPINWYLMADNSWYW